MSIFKQLLVVAVLAGLGFAAWKIGEPPPSGAPTEAAKPDNPVAVIVQRTETAEERIRLEAVGTASAFRSVTLHPESAGEVTALRFTADSYVERGDVLVELRREAEELEVELARVQLENAQRTFGRLEKLSASGTSTQAALDDARTALRSARIALRQAQVALDDRVVKAPFAGYIGLTDIEIGDRIDPATAIATLDDRELLLIRFDVPEAMLGRIAPGDAVTVAPWAGTVSADGIVVDFDSRIDPESRTFVVRAETPNPDDRFRPGMSFRVTLDLYGNTRPAVPEIAIQWGGEGSFLWTIRDGAAARVPVRIVQRQAARVLVDAELEPGDPVVVEGLHRMRAGRPVAVTVRDAPVATNGTGS